jgi:hypothetical protein
MPAISRIVEPAQELKVFWFFSSEKNTFLPITRCRISTPTAHEVEQARRVIAPAERK